MKSRCPHCQQILEISAEFGGNNINCPVCRQYFTVQFDVCDADQAGLFTALKNFCVVFSGRACRKEYWLFVLLQILIGIAFVALSVIGTLLVIYASSAMIIFSPIVCIAQLICSLALIIPNIAVSVRRLHDIGKSGWWWFINLLPVIGPICLFVWSLLDSQPGDNQYGSNPKGVPAIPGYRVKTWLGWLFGIIVFILVIVIWPAI